MWGCSQLVRSEEKNFSHVGSSPTIPAFFKDYMKQKLYYITMGYLLTIINFMLIDTRFTILGIGFGIAAAVCFVKSLYIKK